MSKEQIYLKILHDIEEKYLNNNDDDLDQIIKHFLEKKILFTKIKKKKIDKKNLFQKYLNKIKNCFIFLIIYLSGLFDKKWYLQTYKEVNGQNLHPIIHFIVEGVYLGYNPSKNFSTTIYLEANPSCLKKNQNPMLHFILHNFYRFNHNFSYLKKSPNNLILYCRNNDIKEILIKALNSK